MRPIEWTDEMIEKLIRFFPYSTTDKVAELLKVCPWCVKKKARELGLCKFTKTSVQTRAAIVAENIDRYSYSEIATIAGCSTHSVARIVKSFGLTRKPDAEREIRSRIRKEMLRSERRRLEVGKEPMTRLIVRDKNKPTNNKSDHVH